MIASRVLERPPSIRPIEKLLAPVEHIEVILSQQGPLQICMPFSIVEQQRHILILGLTFLPSIFGTELHLGEVASDSQLLEMQFTSLGVWPLQVGTNIVYASRDMLITLDDHIGRQLVLGNLASLEADMILSA